MTNLKMAMVLTVMLALMPSAAASMPPTNDCLELLNTPTAPQTLQCAGYGLQQAKRLADGGYASVCTFVTGAPDCSIMLA